MILPQTQILLPSSSQDPFSGRNKKIIGTNIEYGRCLFNNFFWKMELREVREQGYA